MTVSEAAIAAAISTWLEAEGWEVFREVSLERHHPRWTVGDGRADLVATRDGQLAVVECKRELSFDLLAQAKRWLPFAHLVYVAFPYTKPTRGHVEACSIALDYGLGILAVQDDEIVPRGSPKVRTSVDEALRLSLRPGHQTHAEAGTNGGGQFTTFRGTVNALAAFVAEHPGCTLAEAIEGTPHHYRSKSGAAGALARSIRKGLVPGVHVGWKQRLFPTGEGARRGFEMPKISQAERGVARAEADRDSDPCEERRDEGGSPSAFKASPGDSSASPGVAAIDRDVP